MFGSADLAQTLMAHDLVDECVLAIHPLVLGSGKKLFRDSEQLRKLELADSTPTTTGVLLTRCRPARWPVVHRDRTGGVNLMSLR